MGAPLHSRDGRGNELTQESDPAPRVARGGQAQVLWSQPPRCTLCRLLLPSLPLGPPSSPPAPQARSCTSSDTGFT